MKRHRSALCMVTFHLHSPSCLLFTSVMRLFIYKLVRAARRDKHLYGEHLEHGEVLSISLFAINQPKNTHDH